MAYYVQRRMYYVQSITDIELRKANMMFAFLFGFESEAEIPFPNPKGWEFHGTL